MLRSLPLYLIMFPAIVVGAIAMHTNDVPPTIWGQNIVIFIVGMFVFSFIVSKNKTADKRLTVPSIIYLLIATFLHSGIDGVHRWVSLGRLQFYVASIFIPLLLIQLWKWQNWWMTFSITIAVAVLLFLQPDASQLSAFLIAMSVLLWDKTSNNVLRLIMLSVATLFITLSWVFIDSLPPVAHAEDILYLVANMGIGWLIVGALSLLLLPLPFLFFRPETDKRLSQSLGIYLIVLLISTFFGNFPMPLMGFGVSPIIGYFIALSWYIRKKQEAGRITYDKQVKMGYIYIFNQRNPYKIAHTEELEITPFIVMDLDEEKRVIGLELFPQEAKILEGNQDKNYVFSKENQRYSLRFNEDAIVCTYVYAGIEFYFSEDNYRGFIGLDIVDLTKYPKEFL
jgi:uncharacterized protein YuzE